MEMPYPSAKVQFIIDINHRFKLKGVKPGEFYEEMTIFASYKQLTEYKYYYE